MADNRVTVATPAGEYRARESAWARAAALLGGTTAMRQAAETYLPKFAAEDTENYQRRLQASVLYGGFGGIVKTMAGLPFSRELDFGDDVLPELVGRGAQQTRETGGWIEDIDGRGNHIQIFAMQVFREALAFGSSSILVDMPDDLPLTGADDLKRRPRWCQYGPRDVIDARLGAVDGQQRFVHLRLREDARVFDGYADTTEPRIREIDTTAAPIWRLWRQVRGEWVVLREGAYGLPFVPFVPFLAGDVRGEFTAQGPLENAAHLNVAHWQSASDQRNILTHARFPVYFFKGVKAADIKIGPGTAIVGDSAGADARVLEMQGAAIAAGERDLQSLKEDMEAESLRMLVRRPTNVTATEVAAEESKDQSDLQMLAGQFSDVLEMAAQYTADWLGRGEGAGGSIAVPTDFGSIANMADAKEVILRLRELGDLAPADAMRELQRIGLLSDALVLEDVEERAAESFARQIQAAAGA